MDCIASSESTNNPRDQHLVSSADSSTSDCETNCGQDLTKIKATMFSSCWSLYDYRQKTKRPWVIIISEAGD